MDASSDEFPLYPSGEYVKGNHEENIHGEENILFR